VITGINHLTLAVRDAEESFRFYNEILRFRPVARWPSGAYFLAGERWVALVQDRHTRTSPLPEHTHVAFTVSSEEFEGIARGILASGARVWKQNESEGASLYFEDPNGHKLEIHVGDLRSRLVSARANPWPGLVFMDRQSE